jgi:DNA-binding response OmpR family regulator
MPRITVIEDDRQVNEALCIVLERSGYSVTTLMDSGDFVPEDVVVPDLFIIDRHLTGIDGLELCRKIKSRPDSMHVPVMIISGSPYINLLADAAGADYFIEKPFSKKQLLESVEQLIAANRQGVKKGDRPYRH